MKLISLDGIKTFLAKLNSLVVHKAGAETVTGAKTFSGGITSTKIKSDSIVTGLKGTHYFQCRKFRGEGDASTYYHAIDFGFSGHNQVDFHEYGGTWNFYMNQDGLSTSGTLVGSIQPDGWHGNVIGNASSATKATQDGSGNVIVDTYATKSSIPTKTSQLTNDSGYLTTHQDLSVYALKTDIPTVPVKGVKVDGSTSNLTPDDSGIVTIPATATKLATARTISLKGHATGSASFDGSSDISIQVKVDYAGNAGGASVATKAKQDGNGNVIVDTYATKAEIPTVPVKGIKVSGSTSNLTADTDGVVTIPAIPTAISSFTNDAGYLTSHQDISGKADKATTLAGYGITDAYTSTEVDEKIKTAISAIADYDSTAF